jgi:hypothetical protein
VLRQFFTDAQLAELTARIEVARPSGLDYYPLVTPGERFPVNDPGLRPRLEPRPEDDAVFLQGEAALGCVCMWKRGEGPWGLGSQGGGG